MAKHKKKKSKHRRRHRVGALTMAPGSPLVMLGSVALGYLAGTQINQAINMLIPATMKTQANTGKVVSAIQVGGGAFLLLGKGKKSLVKSLAGGLLAGAGIKRAMIVFAANTTDTLGGYGQVPVIGMYATPGQINGRRKVAGYGDVPVVGGMGAYTPNSSLTGPAKIVGSMRDGTGYGSGSGSGLMG